jgi:CheY-like chemotaxis protein
MNKRILVVDDEPSILVIFKKVLSQDGHRVHTCLSAAEALSEFALQRFDLAVVDRNLPGITGFDLVSLLRRTAPDLPAVVATAYPEPILALTAKLQGYLAKPFESLKLISDTVRRALELGELQRGWRQQEEAGPRLAPAGAHSRGSR